ncbi:MAG: PGPGW domain-containing protein [Coriobacteriales bacterium]|jgi:hypothetical protein
MARTKKNTDIPNYYEAYIIEDGKRASDYFTTVNASSPSAAAASTGTTKPKALLKIVIGVSLVAVGIPMLVLPGPGLLSIGAGAALVASGSREFKIRNRA